MHVRTSYKQNGTSGSSEGTRNVRNPHQGVWPEVTCQTSHLIHLVISRHHKTCSLVKEKQYTNSEYTLLNYPFNRQKGDSRFDLKTFGNRLQCLMIQLIEKTRVFCQLVAVHPYTNRKCIKNEGNLECFQLYHVIVLLWENLFMTKWGRVLIA